MAKFKSAELLVDQVIGSAYSVVKYVAANMSMLTELSSSIPVLTTYMPDIQAVLTAMPTITHVSDNMGAITSVSDNMAILASIDANMVALLNIDANLPAILAVPAAIAAQDWKNSVLVATTANLGLSGISTVDGVALSVGDRVLVKNQISGSQNGIYIVATGAWTRAPDGLAPNVSTNNCVLVDRGSTNAGKMFRLSTIGAISVGTTVQTWVEHSPTGNLQNEGTGQSLVGSQTGSTMGIKSIKAGANMVVTDDGAGSLVLESSGGSGGGSGEANTTSNVGTGEGLAKPKSGVNLPFKTLKAGSNITLTASTDEVEISASGGSGGGSISASGTDAAGNPISVLSLTSINTDSDDLIFTESPPTSGNVYLSIRETGNSAIANVKRELRMPLPGDGIPTILEDFNNPVLTLPFTGTWSRSTDSPHSGTHCYKTPVTADGAISTAELVGYVITQPSTLSFWIKTDTEENYDLVNFYVDGVLQKSFSGNYTWQQFSVNLGTGMHTISWQYQRDATDGAGTNSAYIDDIAIVPAYANLLDQVDSLVTGADSPVIPGWAPAEQFHIYVGKFDGKLRFKPLAMGKYISIVETADYIQIASNAPPIASSAYPGNSPVARVASGNYIFQATHSSADRVTYNLAADKVVFYPYTPMKDVYPISLGCALKSTGTNVKLGIYNSDPVTGVPTTLVCSATISAASAALANAVVTPGGTALIAGRQYWLAFLSPSAIDISALPYAYVQPIFSHNSWVEDPYTLLFANRAYSSGFLATMGDLNYQNGGNLLIKTNQPIMYIMGTTPIPA